MFGIGFTELLLICFIFVVLVNPKNAPSIISYMRGFYKKIMLLKREFEDYIDHDFHVNNERKTDAYNSHFNNESDKVAKKDSNSNNNDKDNGVITTIIPVEYEDLKKDENEK